MVRHWAEQYIGKPWTQEHDCYYWFRKICLEQFGRDVPVIGADYEQTDHPVEGDAVFIGPQHIGMVIRIGIKMMVLHAVPGLGVTLGDLSRMKITGYWTYAPAAQL